MSQSNNSDNILLSNRKGYTARNSIDALISYARDQDEKIYNRGKRLQTGRFFAILSLVALPSLYYAYSVTIGSWRNIYHSNMLTTAIEAGQNGNQREYFVPEMYLKEREIRKIELGLKDTEELKNLFSNKPAA